MEVKEVSKEGLKRSYAIVVTAAELDAKVNEKLTEAAPDIEMKGFRKGKVPMPLLKKQFGPRVLGEAMQESIDGAMQTHFETTGDRPAMQPEVKMVNEAWKEGEDVHVSVVYEALPEIPDVDLKSLKLERMVVEADDKSIEEALEKLAESAPSFEDRKKGSKAKDGDQIVIDFKGSVNGEFFDGGTAEDYPLVLGSKSFIPGFEDQLVGAKVDDDVEVKVTFPDNYGNKQLSGKAALFACKVKAIREPKKAEVNEDLAKRFGAEDLAALKSQISERLGAEYKTAARTVAKRGLLDALDKAVKFDLPGTLVDAEAGQIAHQLWHEEHHDHQGHDHPAIEPTAEHKSLAERRVRLGLLLAEIGRKQEIKVTDQEMTQAVMNAARQYPGQERQFFEFVQQNAQMRQQLQAPIFEDKVVDYIFENADLKEKKVKKDALQKAVDALDEE